LNQFGRHGDISRDKAIRTPREIINAEINREEKLVWVDAPISLLKHAQTAVPTALFGIPFFGFAVFWTWQATAILRKAPHDNLDGLAYFFPLFGVPFLLVGLSMLLSPAWKALKGRKTLYAITDKRLIIREAFPKISVKSWSLKQLDNLTRVGSADGPGNVIFAEERYKDSDNDWRTNKIGFIGIDQPKKVEDKIRSLMNQQDGAN